MILDAEGAVIDYLTTNMISIVGQGNDSVEIYRYTFPTEAKDTAISVFLELPGNHSDVPELMPVGTRIVTRSSKADISFYLMQNVDLLLDRMVRKAFNASVECCLSRRNSGPGRFNGANALIHFTSLYTMTLRSL